MARPASFWQAGEEYRTHFQRYPVVHLTLKDMKYVPTKIDTTAK